MSMFYIIKTKNKYLKWLRIKLIFKLVNFFDINKFLPEKTLYLNKNRTKTDTGWLVEYTKVFEIIILKELGKLTP